MVGLLIDLLLFASDRMRTAFLTLIGIALLRLATP
jgi:hypothetical protein